jgi:16S rRNA (guanine527-N7)-methyltransferase
VKDLHARLEADAETLGIPLSSAEADHVVAFTALLHRWNGAIRLTGPSDAVTLLREQVIEALLYRPLITRSEAWWDIGSGGGLPALVLAGLEPTITFHLVEPISKKVAFLKQAAITLGLTGRVLVTAGRLADDGAPPADAKHRDGPPRAAMSRATFAPADWFARAAPLVGPDGLVIVTSASPLDAPFASAAEADGRLEARVATLPATGAPRHLALIRVPAA